jgi:nucleoside-diphosphate-sugar epimerase
MAGSDAVAHFATRIPAGFAATRVGAWADNDRLRREATTQLIAAATTASVPRFIFESLALAYPDRGEAWIDESQALDPVSPVMHSALDAEALLGDFAARGGESVALRFGRLYGSGRASAALSAPPGVYNVVDDAPLTQRQ